MNDKKNTKSFFDEEIKKFSKKKSLKEDFFRNMHTFFSQEFINNIQKIAEESTFFYTCGPTVYREPHIGNLRPVITANFVFQSRLFFKKYYKSILISNPDSNVIPKIAKFVHNITDIDDKIINESKITNTKPKVLTEKIFKIYKEILFKIGFKKEEIILEKVTENINLIGKYIGKLLEKKDDVAFLDEKTNSIYFNYKNFSNYGEISGKTISELKQDSAIPNTFVLWKSLVDKNEKKYTWKPFPLSRGRPGWHTECSALIYKHFKKKGCTYHFGGIDLIFPHHENENIQHYALFKAPISKNFFHVGTVNVENKKMSKSEKNEIFLSDFCKNIYGFYDFPKEVLASDILKIVYLFSSPTKPLNISAKKVTEAILIYKKMIASQFLNCFYFWKITQKNSKMINRKPSFLYFFNFIIFKYIAEAKFTKVRPILEFMLKKFSIYDYSFELNYFAKYMGFQYINLTEFKISKNKIIKNFFKKNDFIFFEYYLYKKHKEKIEGKLKNLKNAEKKFFKEVTILKNKLEIINNRIKILEKYKINFLKPNNFIQNLVLDSNLNLVEKNLLLFEENNQIQENWENAFFDFQNIFSTFFSLEKNAKIWKNISKNLVEKWQEKINNFYLIMKINREINYQPFDFRRMFDFLSFQTESEKK